MPSVANAYSTRIVICEFGDFSQQNNRINFSGKYDLIEDIESIYQYVSCEPGSKLLFSFCKQLKKQLENSEITRH